MAAPAAASPKIQVLRSHERGHSDIGWLNSYHTFSFADYHNSKKERNQWSHLRVINEDRVAPTQGFPTHPHRDFEIYSYIISGAIEHKDSMGNVEVLHRGDIQFTSAGTGIAHSEFNASEKDMLHFIQIWVRPNRTGLKPNYQTKHYSEDDKKNRLRLVVSPTGEDNTIKINNDCFMYASLLEQGKSVTHNFAAANRKGFLHVAHTGGAVQLSDGSKLQAGDGAYIDAGTESLTITGLSEKPAEFLLWDLENK